MSDQSFEVFPISGSDGELIDEIAVGCGPMLPEHKWPLWAGGYHLPEILQDPDSLPPSITGEEQEPTDFHCPETYTVTGGGIIGGVKQDPETFDDLD